MYTPPGYATGSGRGKRSKMALLNGVCARTHSNAHANTQMHLCLRAPWPTNWHPCTPPPLCIGLGITTLSDHVQVVSTVTRVDVAGDAHHNGIAVCYLSRSHVSTCDDGTAWVDGGPNAAVCHPKPAAMYTDRLIQLEIFQDSVVRGNQSPGGLNSMFGCLKWVRLDICGTNSNCSQTPWHPL